MLDASFRIALDPLFPPNDFAVSCKRTAALPLETKYELVFDEEVDGPELDEILKKQEEIIIEIEDEDEDSDNESEEEEDEEEDAPNNFLLGN